MLIADNNYFGRAFEADLDTEGLDLLRPARKGEQPRPGTELFKPLRHIIESVNQTLRGQLDLQTSQRPSPRRGLRPHRPTHPGVDRRDLWHNDHLGNDIRRSLTAYDH